MSRVRELKLKGKSHDIPKRLVWDAWLKVKSNGGAAGADGVTLEQFEEDLSGNLYRLWNRMSSGSYHPGPVRAVEIPKKGKQGGIRVLGIPNVVDRVAMVAAATALEPSVEPVFHEDSYGYRPGRSPVDAVAVCRERCWKRDWVVDLDIRAFFTQLDQGWLERFLEHRIADKRILRLIQKWLRAGVIEDGEWSDTEAGTAQGASVSPLLSNVFLHYVFDLWADQWRRRKARGDVVLVRFADDFLAGFQHREDAERFLADLRERFAGFGLELHPDKTRLIEFGRYAAERRKARGDRKPETFEFLGFTHICAKDRHGRFKLKRVTSKEKMRSKLKAVKTEMRRRMHLPIPEQGRWLARVLEGHYNYYAVPDNSEAMRAFRRRVVRHWRAALKRRSQKGWTTWERIDRLAARWLPQPRILHPWPDKRFDAKTRGRSPVR